MNTILAKDIMNTNLLFVYEGWSIRYLADFFITNNINGAPVLTTEKKPVGVVSVTDIFRFENQELEKKTDALKDYYQTTYGNDLFGLDLQNWSQNAEENCTVHQIMQRCVVQINEDATLKEVCICLTENDIHRVFVSAGNDICGVITSTDIFRAIAES